MPTAPEGMTQLLMDWSNGNRNALDRLMPLVYEELRRLAKRHMARERREHTLQTSALINEAYLRLVGQKNAQWQNRAHFFAVAAQVMRHILIDHARSQNYAKRGGGAQKVCFDETAIVFTEERAAQLVALDDALNTLAAVDPRKSRVVELRFFGGLNIEETAEVLKISPATVEREWRAAKGWLNRFLSKTKPVPNA